MIKVVPRVEVAIAGELEQRPMELVCSGLRYDQDLPAAPLAIFGAIGVCNHVEFPDSVDPEQLAAGAAWRKNDVACTGVLNAVQHEDIGVGALPAHGKHIGPGPASCLIPGDSRIIERTRVQGDQIIETAPIQGQFFHLLFAY